MPSHLLLCQMLAHDKSRQVKNFQRVMSAQGCPLRSTVTSLPLCVRIRIIRMAIPMKVLESGFDALLHQLLQLLLQPLLQPLQVADKIDAMTG
jgi:hypothetical protein